MTTSTISHEDKQLLYIYNKECVISTALTMQVLAVGDIEFLTLKALVICLLIKCHTKKFTEDPEMTDASIREILKVSKIFFKK